MEGGTYINSEGEPIVRFDNTVACECSGCCDAFCWRCISRCVGQTRQTKASRHRHHHRSNQHLPVLMCTRPDRRIVVKCIHVFACCCGCKGLHTCLRRKAWRARCVHPSLSSMPFSRTQTRLKRSQRARARCRGSAWPAATRCACRPHRVASSTPTAASHTPSPCTCCTPSARSTAARADARGSETAAATAEAR